MYSSEKTILLLNPPGRRLYVRDYYCSKISKADYIYHPTDLLTASGWLAPEFKLVVLDCIVDGMSSSAALEQIFHTQPDAIFFLTGSVSQKEDFAFLAEVKAQDNPLMIGSGDCLLDEHEKIKANAPWLDAIVLDFTSEGLRNFLRNEFAGGHFATPQIIDFRKPAIPETCAQKRTKGKNLELPVPRHDLFSNTKYRYPFVRSRPFASVLTDYGCPFRCKFCVMAELGFKRRSVPNVLEELDYVHALGIRDIYFVDQTFGCNRGRLHELCSQMIERGYKFRWVAFTRADVVDKNTLQLMYRAGCHMLMFGIESPIQRVLDELKKDIKLEEIERCFNWCREIGISTLATFIVGLPGTTYEENERIADYAIAIRADYASFNVLVPRVNTELRREAMANNWLDTNKVELDQSGAYGALETGTLSEKQIREVHRKITWRFFFRWRYILDRLISIRTYYDVHSIVRNGFRILTNLLSQSSLFSKKNSQW